MEIKGTFYDLTYDSSLMNRAWELPIKNSIISCFYYKNSPNHLARIMEELLSDISLDSNNCIISLSIYDKSDRFDIIKSKGSQGNKMVYTACIFSEQDNPINKCTCKISIRI